MAAAVLVLYLPLAHETHEPSLEHVLVLDRTLGAGHEQPERKVPAGQPLEAHGVWLCGWCVCGVCGWCG